MHLFREDDLDGLGFPIDEAGFLILDFDGSESQAAAIRQAILHATNEARLDAGIQEALDVLDNNISAAIYSVATGTDPSVFRVMLFKEWRDVLRLIGRD